MRHEDKWKLSDQDYKFTYIMYVATLCILYSSYVCVVFHFAFSTSYL